MTFVCLPNVWDKINKMAYTAKDPCPPRRFLYLKKKKVGGGKEEEEKEEEEEEKMSIC